jgi:2-oxoglutarate dehydrogenase E2 component (dihydrolipoamide succinyltransferase)
LLVQWYRQDGDLVKRDDLLFLIETDKVTLEVAAETGGRLQILVEAGQTVPVGAVVATLETLDEPALQEGAPAEAVAHPLGELPKVQPMESHEPPSPATGASEPAFGLPPSVQALVENMGLDLSQITGTGPAGSVTRGDVLLHLEAAAEGSAQVRAQDAEATQDRKTEFDTPTEASPRWQPVSRGPVAAAEEPLVTRKPMSRIRMRIAERLLEARHNTAMLTTFNEIDMSRVQEIRTTFKEVFKKKHGVGLGIMSFFIKAAVEALKAYPEVNAFIEGHEVVYHHYCHVGVAVGAERGLVVPVIRHADRLSFAQLEQAIVDYVRKVQENRLEISDMEDGTFTISNGGVFGSLLSTPILNTPQSGILGMHKIEDRPIVVNGAIVARPMMYVALSYDHRIIDGRKAVGFLRHIKECVEQPERILIGI